MSLHGTTSILRCELNTDGVLGENTVIAQCGHMGHLWRVLVDGESIASMAMPFAPSDGWIELEGDPRGAWYGDGLRYVWVRRLGDIVLWFNPPPGRDNLGVFSPGLEPGQTILFGFEQYVAETERWVSLDLYSGEIKGDLSGQSLPALKPAELSSILAADFPGEEPPLYTTPEIPDDRNGRKLIARVRQMLIETPVDRVETCDEPAEVLDLRIGLDSDDFPECLWRIGRGKAGMAVQFVSHPKFPVWLCGEEIDAVFRSAWPQNLG